MFYRSPRLFLRPAWPEDCQDIWQGIADEGITRNLATAPWPYTRDHARDFVSLLRDPAYPAFLLTQPSEDGAVIGCAGLADHGGKAELGYWIARPYWGQGYATEAANAVLEIARMLGHHQVVASHFLDNPASGRVLRKAGFRPTGRVEPHHCLARGEAANAAVYVRDLDEDSQMPQRAA
ncbi:GNAT family N-acetyltransferase [Allopontixanthobacter sp.]|uniref:GNAT family N-acetyltransferase n=1 Tax=Allopontixanthobacter sp. TaxID=2906452 RepID=UPI002AB8E116|nr:GNAT family N-acetyltransferase [Allopontixanthobacter sp.]MDZ4308424.1 GNAT family N-acetyltransferase [Allopontixanthobacter sp.]